MAIKCELTNDAARGPGHGLIRLSGLSAGDIPRAYCIERNQGSLPYLGEDGNWQAQETWHRVTAERAGAATGRVELRVGPEVVDPIVEQPQHVMCRLTLDCAGDKQTAALKIHRPLLSSKAQGLPSAVSGPIETPPERAPEELAPPEDEAPGPSEVPVPEPEPILPEGGRKPWRTALWVLVPSLLLVAAGWSWWDCRIPALPGPNCGATGGVVANPLPPVDALPRNCSGLDGEGCLSMATRAAQAGQLDLGRQLLQEAGGLGAVKAYLRLAQMYDPATWAADQSPVAQADWETAAYWYDEAARAGDTAGMLGAGRLYCGSAGDAAFRSHGAELLRQAVAAAPSDAVAAKALKECEERLK